MTYFSSLGLQKEPFSTSPDPQFFYHSAGHESALKRLEIAIRLRRGLSIVLGDVGTGKTTLSRALLQNFKDENDYVFHIMLDPGFKSEFQFLTALVKIFGITGAVNSIVDFKEGLEKYLFHNGVDEGKTVVLIIDEGQKISPENLEVLRTLLNYETNEYKLLQLVIMAQIEFLPCISRIHNLMDRVVLKYTINPLDETETKEMIEFRLKAAGYNNAEPLFTQEAIKLIYQYTQGLPRKIALLCHNSLEQAIMSERTVVDADLINGLIHEEIRS